VVKTKLCSFVAFSNEIRFRSGKKIRPNNQDSNRSASRLKAQIALRGAVVDKTLLINELNVNDKFFVSSGTKGLFLKRKEKEISFVYAILKARKVIQVLKSTTQEQTKFLL